MKTVCLYMAKKALDFHVPDDNHSKIRSTCAWEYANWLHTLDVSDRIFLPEQRDRAAKSARLFCVVLSNVGRRVDFSEQLLVQGAA